MPEVTYVKYKVGDVVRATENVRCDEVRPGYIGVIVASDNASVPYPICVRFFLDPDQETWPCTLEEVEPVETPDP